MLQSSKLLLKAALLFFVLINFVPINGLCAQESPTPHPPDYPGVKTYIPGVFVTPVAGAPFSGTVEILSKQSMPDGSVYTRRTINHIARNSSGVIHNERRKLEPPGFQGEPRILSSHIYDPQTRLSTFLDPKTHLARQIVLRTPPSAPANSTPDTAIALPNAQNLRTQDLGTETVAGLILHGTRKLRTVPATLSGTGREITITDDYWYSDDLKVYLVLRHNDPRTGEQFVGIIKVDRKEPDASNFQIPPAYKIVDETPVGQSQQ
ncbi:MAG TPA: hypothetical protein VF845_02115 [Terriglobales bacterium]